ncbi:MAG: thioredoxin family protein [Marinosulfonomonas sp.]
MAAVPPVCDFGWSAPNFTLPATDGKIYSLADLRGENGTMIVFICNHCPYVLAILDRLKRDAADLQKIGIGFAAICSNDAVSHPADSLPKMIELAEREGLAFPYLRDEDQSVARAYGAVCTPDFFGFNAKDELQYRGRLDASGRSPGPTDAVREMYQAMKLVAETGRGPADQTASMGCAIKWKTA